MLALTRKRNESIILTVPTENNKFEKILITVINAREGRTRLGIEASDNVKIDRKEIHDRKIMENSHKVQ